jgi:hypothetical protein
MNVGSTKKEKTPSTTETKPVRRGWREFGAAAFAQAKLPGPRRERALRSRRRRCIEADRMVSVTVSPIQAASGHGWAWALQREPRVHAAKAERPRIDA